MQDTNTEQVQDMSGIVPDYDALAVTGDDPDADVDVKDLDGPYLGERHSTAANAQQTDNQQQAPTPKEEPDPLDPLGVLGTQQQEGSEPSEPGPDDQVIKLDDGEEVTLGDLKRNNMFQRDYTQKTERLAADRREVEGIRQNYQAAVNQLQAQNNALLQFVQGLVPPEPDIALAQTNAKDYQYQTALRQRAINEIQQIMQVKHQTNDLARQTYEANLAKVKETEEFKLLNSIPRLRDPQKRSEYMRVVKQTGRDFGFDDKEMENIYDHRVLQMVYYANLGKIAERNRGKIRQQAKKSPNNVTNLRSGNRGKSVTNPRANQAALERLSGDPTLENAMGVDFDF